MRISDWSSDVCSSDLRRSIGKHMAQMSVAIGATHFRADRAELGVAMLAYDRRIDWRGEAWPSRARIEFGVACEQRRSAAGAAVHPGVVIIPVFAGESPLGAGLAQNMILIGRSEEHPSELQSLMRSSYAVFCLNNKTFTH